MEIFSERQGHQLPREREEIDDGTRDGICALIAARVEDGSFGGSFRWNCEDEPVAIGTDADNFWRAMNASVPGESRWPQGCDQYWVEMVGAPSTLQILDTIEFCWQHVAKPIAGRYHPHFGHSHLTFDKGSGQEGFRQAVEDIFRRNGSAYTLTEGGRVERLLPSELEASIARSAFQTGDKELDRLLTVARTKFLDPDIERRREALEALWDAWERLKTVGPGSNKKAQVQAMLDATAGTNSTKFREALEEEAKELTRIGNTLRIRHSETTQEILATSEHVDYVFQRMFSLIWMILRTQKMVGVQT
ncbi:MAG: hypothetical protein OXN89_02305 [Bryobacterales bacterium]|nr:hypothetical protein [Bryobacterales bacterium]